MALNEGFITAYDGVRLSYTMLGTGGNTIVIPNAVHMIDSFQGLASRHTVIFFDLRNRGRSESVGDRKLLARGIHHDVDDIEAIRQDFGVEKFTLLGHSYVGLTAILYAMKFGRSLDRVIQIGPSQSRAGTQYPAHLTCVDATFVAFMNKLSQLHQNKTENPLEAGRKFWDALRELMVFRPADAEKINWTPYRYPNELNFMPHWMENLSPSIQALKLSADDLSNVKMPVLVIHGRKDRQSPYGAGREWALTLPNGRLITIEDAAHVPWIEAPELIFDSIETFLQGVWPEVAEQVRSL